MGFHTLEFDLSKYMSAAYGFCGFRHEALPIYRTFEFSVMGADPKIEQVTYDGHYKFLFTLSGQRSPFVRIDEPGDLIAFKRCQFLILPDGADIPGKWAHGLTFKFWADNFKPYHLVYPQEFKP